MEYKYQYRLNNGVTHHFKCHYKLNKGIPYITSYANTLDYKLHNKMTTRLFEQAYLYTSSSYIPLPEPACSW